MILVFYHEIIEILWILCKTSAVTYKETVIFMMHFWVLCYGSAEPYESSQWIEYKEIFLVFYSENEVTSSAIYSKH